MAPKKPSTSKSVPTFFSKMSADLACAVTAAEAAVNSQETLLPFDDPYLTWATGGGLCLNRINVFAGQSGTGKTFLCAMAAGMLQKERPDAWVVIMDIEYYYHNKPERIQRLSKFGINLSQCFIVSSNEPDVIFAKLGELEQSLKDGEFELCCLVVDSLGGLEDKETAEKINEGEISASGNKMGGNAKMITALVKRLVRIAAEQSTTICMVQHAIVDIAGMAKSGGKGATKYIVTGGQKLRLLADLMILSENIERKDALVAAGDVTVAFDDRDVVAVGKAVRFKVLKSRDTMEGKQAEVKFNFSTCEIIQREQSLFNLAKLLGVMVHPINEATGKESQQWWSVSGKTEKYHGEPQAVKAMADKKLFNEVLALCMAVKDTPAGYNANDTIDIQLGE